MPRIFTFNSPLGDALLFRRMDGQDGLSSLFNFTVRLASTNNAIKPDALLDNGATIVMGLERDAKRYLSNR